MASVQAETLATPLDFEIDLPIRSEWGNVEELRATVERTIGLVSPDRDAAHALSMIAAELAENAVKYGYWARGEGHVRVRIWGDFPAAHVAVENPLPTGGTVPAELDTVLGWIAGFPTARAAYEAKVTQAAAQPSTGRSGLGLVRISYEGGCTLRAEVTGTTLRVVADVDLGAGA